MNGYKAFAFRNKQGKNLLLLEAVVETAEKVNLQGFLVGGSGEAFSLFFEKNLSEEELLEKALEDGSNRVKNFENWDGEKEEITLKDLGLEKALLITVKESCKSENLPKDIDDLLNNRQSASSVDFNWQSKGNWHC